ncbi:hypothetical protein NO365_04486 (plasmid) [Planktothrix agardhii]|jgi:uncharacterized protein YecT (DUF1311 family)|nr:hypothetical protein NO365_04486 [Planktothrix agardhii]
MKRKLLFNLTIIFAVLENCFLPGYANPSLTVKPQSQQIAQLQVNCNNPKTDLETKECIRLRYVAADQRLNQVYQQIIPTLNSEERSEAGFNYEIITANLKFTEVERVQVIEDFSMNVWSA